MRLIPYAAALVVGIAFTPAVGAQTRGATPETQAPSKSYPKDLPAKLVKEARITEPAAAEAALKAVPGGTIEKMELEKEDGKFIYSYDIKVAGKSGIQEVHIDAMTGALIANVHETPADQAAEKAKDAKATPAKAKKP